MDVDEAAADKGKGGKAANERDAAERERQRFLEVCVRLLVCLFESVCECVCVCVSAYTRAHVCVCVCVCACSVLAINITQ